MESFQEFYPFFMTALDSGKLGICRWMESGTNVDTALPQLCELTDDKEEWRAIIVRVEDEEAMRQHEASPQNPYDFGEEDPCSESSIPLIRLTHILGGVPAPDVRFDYVQEGYKNGLVNMVYRPVRDEEADAAYRELSEKYAYNGKRPKEIILISLREKKVSDMADTRNAWKSRMEMSESEFWKRNRYPGNCRFLVYDLTRQGNTQRVADMYDFWLSVFLFSINDINPSSLQAYRLYSMRACIDRKVMSSYFQEVGEKLVGAKRYLERTIQQDLLKKLEVKKELPNFILRVPVNLDIKKNGTYEVESREFKLFPQSKTEDYNKWFSMKVNSERRLDETLKQLERALDHTAEQMRYVCQVSYDEVEPLDKYQIQDMEDELKEIYGTILHRQKDLPGKKATIDENLDQAAEQVQRAIPLRVNLTGALRTVALIFGVILVSILPAFYFISKEEWGSVGGIASFFGGFLVLLVLAELIVILVKRKEFSDKIETYNSLIEKTIQEIFTNSDVFSGFMSKVASYAKGSSYLNTLRHKDFECDNSYYFMQNHLSYAGRLLEKLKKWSAAFYLPFSFSAESYDSVDVDIYKAPSHNELYSLCTAKPNRIPLNDTGDTIISPVEFATKLIIEREEVYDDVK